MNYLIVFIFTWILGAVLTVVMEKLSFKWGFLDIPGGRHMHLKPTPLLGGLAIFLSVSAALWLTRDQLFAGNLTAAHWWGVWSGAIIVVIGGLLDDKFNLSPLKQTIFPLLAVAAVLLGGVSIEKIGNPLGGYFYLTPLLSAVLVSLWLLGMMYTTKLLDGMDGLVSGVGAIGAMIIFLFTVTTKWYQPDIAWAALALSGGAAGFLLRNWHPAKSFLGESGALFIGFALGVLSIISGGKFAVALLIMGIPILDVVWTIIRRILAKQNPFKSADRGHLHFRLLSAGLSSRQAAAIYYVFAILFGLAALFLQAKGKILLLSALLLIMTAAVMMFCWLDKKGKVI